MKRKQWKLISALSLLGIIIVSPIMILNYTHTHSVVTSYDNITTNSISKATADEDFTIYGDGLPGSGLNASDSLTFRPTGTGNDVQILLANITHFTNNFNIPSTVTDASGASHSVTLIRDGVFYRNQYINGTVQIPGSVTEVGPDAFYECDSITQLQTNFGLERIDQRAFAGCVNIQGDILFPSSCNTIIAYAFYNCAHLTRITFQADKVFIGFRAFYNCISLYLLTLPNELYTENDAFADCDLDQVYVTNGEIIPVVHYDDVPTDSIGDFPHNWDGYALGNGMFSHSIVGGIRNDGDLELFINTTKNDEVMKAWRSIALGCRETTNPERLGLGLEKTQQVTYWTSNDANTDYTLAIILGTVLPALIIASAISICYIYRLKYKHHK